MTTQSDAPRMGDLIRYKFTNADGEVIERKGTIVAILSMQYLVINDKGMEDFAFKRDVIK